jgi:hypothetical protein
MLFILCFAFLLFQPVCYKENFSKILVGGLSGPFQISTEQIFICYKESSRLLVGIESFPPKKLFFLRRKFDFAGSRCKMHRWQGRGRVYD